jgi:hypothetical protein
LSEQWHFEVLIQKKKKMWCGKGQGKNTLNATLPFSLPYLAYGNGFAWKSQPSAYFALVVGCLPAKDRYTQDFYCLTSGQNMKILYILLHILNLFMNLLCIHCSVQIQNMLMNSK